MTVRSGSRGGTRPSRRPVSLGGSIVGGALASAAILLANQLADRLRLTDFDLLSILGLTFRDLGQDGVKPAGLVWYGIWGGLVVPSLYWAGFGLLGRAGAGPGALFGLVNYLVSGAILGATTPRHPKRRVGRGRPMGAFVSRYGPLEWLANLAGHLLYGIVVGRAAETQASSSSAGLP